MVNVPPLVWFVWNCEWNECIVTLETSSHPKMRTRPKRGRRRLRGHDQSRHVARGDRDPAPVNDAVAILVLEVAPDLATADVEVEIVTDSTTKRVTVFTSLISTRMRTSATWSESLASMVHWKRSGWRALCLALLLSSFGIARTRRMHSAKPTVSKSADVACASLSQSRAAEIASAAAAVIGEIAGTVGIFVIRAAGSTRRWSATSVESGVTFPGTARIQSTGTNAPQVPEEAEKAATTDQPGTNEHF